jgi:hypothetical protein
MYVKTLDHYTSDRTGKNTTALYICYSMIIKGKKMSTQQVSMWTMEGKILQMAAYLTI